MTAANHPAARVMEVVTSVAGTVEPVGGRIAQVDSKLATLEARAVKLTVVANVAALPIAADVHEFYRVANNTTDLYLGNGAGKPLRKLKTTLL